MIRYKVAFIQNTLCASKDGFVPNIMRELANHKHQGKIARKSFY